MKKLHILCIEDEPEVLDAILRDLEVFESSFSLQSAQDAKEAKELIDDMNPAQEAVALIFCDHILPGQRGIDLLTELHKQDLPQLQNTRKVLFTGQAGHDETIVAINEAGIHHYIAKPWDPTRLQETAKQLLTDYVIRQKLPPLPYMKVLDTRRLTEYIHDQNVIHDAG